MSTQHVKIFIVERKQKSTQKVCFKNLVYEKTCDYRVLYNGTVQDFIVFIFKKKPKTLTFFKSLHKLIKTVKVVVSQKKKLKNALNESFLNLNFSIYKTLES